MKRLAVVLAAAILFALWAQEGIAGSKKDDYQTNYLTEKCKARITESGDDFFKAHIICRRTYDVADWRCEISPESKDSYKCVHTLKGTAKFIFGSRRNVMGAICGFCP